MILCRSGLCLPVPATVVNKLYLIVLRERSRASITAMIVLVWVRALHKDKHSSRVIRTEQRLTDLAILAIEKELTSDLSLDAVVNEFATADKNRRIVLVYKYDHEICCLFTVAFMNNWAQRALKPVKSGTNFLGELAPRPSSLLPASR